MPNTFLGAAVVLIALIPGALYTWSFERQVGRWGIGLSDRILRFVGGSAIFHAAFAPLTYWLWADQWERVRNKDSLSLWLWLTVVAYVAIPSAVGTIVGRGTRAGTKWSKVLVGPDPAPRAWDFLFQGHDLDGWVRLRLKSGIWLGGAFATANGRPSYAAGYPEEQDLYLAAAVRVDPDSGEFLRLDDGSLDILTGGILIRWEEVEYLEFIDS